MLIQCLKTPTVEVSIMSGSVKIFAFPDVLFVQRLWTENIPRAFLAYSVYKNTNSKYQSNVAHRARVKRKRANVTTHTEPWISVLLACKSIFRWECQSLESSSQVEFLFKEAFQSYRNGCILISILRIWKLW